MTSIEAIAASSYLASVYLLAKNNPLGWWAGLIGTLLYMLIFYRVWLPGEIAVQAYFLLTSLWGIRQWLIGGEENTPLPVSRLPRWELRISIVLGLVAWAFFYWAFTRIAGKIPFWDSGTMVASFIAQYFLVKRYVENWHLWIAVDLVYVPLYASRGLYITAGLYAIFLVLAWRGLKNFKAELDA